MEGTFYSSINQWVQNGDLGTFMRIQPALMELMGYVESMQPTTWRYVITAVIYIYIYVHIHI